MKAFSNRKTQLAMAAAILAATPGLLHAATLTITTDNYLSNNYNGSNADTGTGTYVGVGNGGYGAVMITNNGPGSAAPINTSSFSSFVDVWNPASGYVPSSDSTSGGFQYTNIKGATGGYGLFRWTNLTIIGQQADALYGAGNWTLNQVDLTYRHSDFGNAQNGTIAPTGTQSGYIDFYQVNTNLAAGGIDPNQNIIHSPTNTTASTWFTPASSFPSTFNFNTAGTTFGQLGGLPLVSTTPLLGSVPYNKSTSPTNLQETQTLPSSFLSSALSDITVGDTASGSLMLAVLAEGSTVAAFKAETFGSGIAPTLSFIITPINAPSPFIFTGSTAWSNTAASQFTHVGTPTAWTDDVSGLVQFGSAVGVTGTGGQTVTLTGPRTAGTLIFAGPSSAGTTFGYIIAGSSANSVTLAGYQGQSLIVHSSGSITAPVTLTYPAYNSVLGQAQNDQWQVDPSQTLTVSGTISGSTNIEIVGGGKVLLTANNAAGTTAAPYTGSITVTTGTLGLSNSNNTGSAPVLFLNGGTLLLQSGFVLASNNAIGLTKKGGTIFVDTGVNITFNNSTGDLENRDPAFPGQYTFVTNFIKDGAGTLTLDSPVNGNNSFLYANCTVNAGVVKILGTDANGISRLGTQILNVNSGGILQIGDATHNVGLGNTTASDTISYIDLNDGGELLGGGNSQITHLVQYTTGTGTAAVTNIVHTSSLSAVTGTSSHVNNVIFSALPGATLTLNSPVGQFDLSGKYLGSSYATIHVTGTGGTINLAALSLPANGGDSSLHKYLFAGDWSIDSGTLKLSVNPGTTMNPLDQLGYQGDKIAGFTNPDRALASLSTVSINTGGTLLITTNVDQNSVLSALPQTVLLNGGTLASVGLDSNGLRLSGGFGVAGNSTLPLYDSVTGSAVSTFILPTTSASAPTTSTWSGGTLTLDPGATFGSKLVYAGATSGGNGTVSSGAAIFIKANATLEVQGTSSLYDTSASRGVAIQVASGGAFNATSGISTVGLISGAGVTTVSPGAVLNATAIQTTTGSVSVNGSLTILSHGTPKVASVVNSLTIAGGVLDLTNNDLILPSATVTSANAMLTAGSITSSSTTLLGHNHAATLLAMTGAQYQTITGGLTLDDQTVTAGETVIKYALYGDTSFKGSVSIDDYLAIDSSFTKGLTFTPGISGWKFGDFNGDGVINAADYALIDNGYAAQGGYLADALISEHIAEFGSDYLVAAQALAVPEPTSLALLGLGAVGLLARRKR